MKVSQHIGEQPAVLPVVACGVRAQLSGIASLPTAPDRIVMVGVGSSMNALVAGAEALMRQTGAVIEFREPLGFAELPPRRQGNVLVVAMSQGGQSATTVAAARRACELGFPTLAITANADSEIAHSGAATVVVPIGEETIGPKTKGYTACVTALLVLADHLSGTERKLDGFEAELTRLLPLVEARVGQAVAGMGIPDLITIAGRLGHVGTAVEAALKIVEMSGVPAIGLDTEEAMHGRFHAHGPAARAILITRGGEDLAMALHTEATLAARGTTALICDMSGEGPCLGGDPLPWPRSAGPGWDVVWGAMPFQLMAVALARAKGMAPADMVYPGLGRALGTKLVA